MNILFKEHMKNPDISRQYHIIHAGYLVSLYILTKKTLSLDFSIYAMWKTKFNWEMRTFLYCAFYIITHFCYILASVQFNFSKINSQTYGFYSLSIHLLIKSQL